MANLGTIGVKGCETKAMKVGNASPSFSGVVLKGCETKGAPGVLGARPAERFQSLVALAGQRFVLGGEDFIQGLPAAPSLRMDGKGSWRFQWVLAPGSHTIQVNVMQAINQSPRPSLVVKANPSIGINADVEVFAASGAGWTPLVSSAVVATALGAVWVELRCNLETNVAFFPCYWDHIIADGGNLLCDFNVWLEGAPVIFQVTPGGTITTTPVFMAQKLHLIVRPVAPNPPAQNNPKQVQDAVMDLQAWTRSAEKAFRAIEAAFNKATGAS